MRVKLRKVASGGEKGKEAKGESYIITLPKALITSTEFSKAKEVEITIVSPDELKLKAVKE